MLPALYYLSSFVICSSSIVFNLGHKPAFINLLFVLFLVSFGLFLLSKSPHISRFKSSVILFFSLILPSILLSLLSAIPQLRTIFLTRFLKFSLAFSESFSEKLSWDLIFAVILGSNSNTIKSFDSGRFDLYNYALKATFHNPFLSPNLGTEIMVVFRYN